MSKVKEVEALLEMLSKQNFTDWFEKEYVPNFIEESPTPQALVVLKERLGRMWEAAKSVVTKK